MDRAMIGPWALGMALGVMAGATACAPRASQGGCDDSLDCARGEMCELDTNECLATGLQTTATADPAPADFQNTIAPFHRGEICLPLEVESGSTMPILMRPCMHPCISVSSFEFRHTFECLGSSCDALALMWMNTSGSNCPPDAFGSFDPVQCVYGTEVEFPLVTETSNGPIRGNMRVEVPFLSNEDAATLAADPSDNDTIDQLVQQYPLSDNRVPNGESVSIQNSHATPPASCRDGACNCFPIGF